MDSRPFLIPGDDLKTWLKDRQKRRRQTCQPDEIFCFGCRAPRRPQPDSVTIVPRNEKTTIIKGRCPVCGSTMNRAGSIARLEDTKRAFGVRTIGQEHLLAPTGIKIMNPFGRRFGDSDDPVILCDNDSGFDRVAFLLAEISAPLFSAWPLDRLFRAVDNRGFDLLTTDADHVLHPENPRGHSFDPPQGLANEVSDRLVALWSDATLGDILRYCR